jgi:hypothetical protein
MKEAKQPERTTIGARWLKVYVVHGVPSRELTRDEWIGNRQLIHQAEVALGEKIYEEIFEGEN